MTVSEADRLKAVERVRHAIAPIFGGSPSYKRKRGIYRALDRKDLVVTMRYESELGMIRMMDSLCRAFYEPMAEMMSKPLFFGFSDKKES